MTVERLQRDAAIEMGLEVAGPDRDRPVIGGDRIGVAREARQRIAAVEMQLRVRRMSAQERVILRQRFGETSKRGQRIAAIDARTEMLGRKTNGPIEGGERIRGPAKLHQHVAAIVERVRIVGRRCQRLIEARERLGVAIERSERKPAIRERIGGAGIDLEGRLDQGERGPGAAAPELDEADENQGIVAVGQRFENAGADLLGLVQTALPVEVHGVGISLRDVGQRTRTGSGHAATWRSQASPSSPRAKARCAASRWIGRTCPPRSRNAVTSTAASSV